jgi:hypothetical protein
MDVARMKPGATCSRVLREFMCTPPYVQIMTSLMPFMGPTKFVTWTIPAADGRPNIAGGPEHLASG